MFAAGIYPGASGPVVARAFGRLYALVLVAAWASLGSQIRLLIGERGLLPLQPFLVELHQQDVPWGQFPSPFYWPALAGDGWLVAGTVAGVLLGAAALFGLRPRVCFALSTALYLGYATACRSFLGFQWDNLLLECGLLASVLPQTRPAPLVHLLFRVVMFKLYFESGLAKAQSGLGDWVDGSAMSFYYETAPLPTLLGYFAHNLPAWWHQIESRIVLVGELVVPFAMFGPRPARLGAALVLTLFQVTNLATANYGFFCFLALALHLFLLDEADVVRLETRLRARLRGWLPARLAVRPPVGAPASPAPAMDRLDGPRRALGIGGAALLLTISLLEGIERFGPGRPSLIPPAWQRFYAPLRMVNSYHLFASVTRDRIEPTFETRAAGGAFTAQHLRRKPGDPGQAPPLVAPHQPRVDFLLWFHGLSWQRTPAYVVNLLDRLCHDPAAVAPLFRAPLPDRPQAVRVSYLRYRMTPVTAWRRTGAYWRVANEGTGPEVSCDR
jgi:lipase maturation factor 1